MSNLTSGTFSGFVDAVEILPTSAPVYFGGGGDFAKKPVEVEVYTSGNNGQLDMSISTEDSSFLVYAALQKGNGVPIGLTKAVASIRRSSTGSVDMITLKDDGVCEFCAKLLHH